MVEDKLKNIIIDRYGSVRHFAERIQIPYTTVDTIFKRGVSKANVVNVLAICNALDISIDSLVNDNKIVFNDVILEKNVNVGDNTLDHIILDKTKPLSSEDKQKIIDIIDVYTK